MYIYIIQSYILNAFTFMIKANNYIDKKEPIKHGIKCYILQVCY
jgi:hypothetical protein